MDDTPELPFQTDSHSQKWLAHVTKHERARWEAKPQSEKDWWYANIKPKDRGKELRREIKIMAWHNELLHLPEEERAAILKPIQDEADAAHIRLKEFFSNPSSEA